MSDVDHTHSESELLGKRLTACRLLRGVDPAFVATLSKVSSIARFKQGDRIWAHSDRARFFHQVLSGVMELRRATAAHEATLVALFGPGECPGVPVALEQSQLVASAYASTATVEILRIPVEPVIARLETDIVLARSIHRALLDHCRLLHSKIDVLTAGPVHQRVAVFFLNLNDRFGDEREDGTHLIPFGLSRQLVASYVNARVETVIRTITSWRREGLVHMEREHVVIDQIAALRLLAE